MKDESLKAVQAIFHILVTCRNIAIFCWLPNRSRWFITEDGHKISKNLLLCRRGDGQKKN